MAEPIALPLGDKIIQYADFGADIDWISRNVGLWLLIFLEEWLFQFKNK